MKIKYLFIVLMSAALFSCEDIETPDLGSDSAWLQFESSSDNMSEASPSKQIPILYASNENAAGVDVSFTYTSSVPSGFTVEPANGVVTIPAGEFVGYITVVPENDVIANEDILLTFSIEGNTDVAIGIAGEGVNNVTSSFTIIEDDCPIAINDFVGTYSVSEVFTSGLNEGVSLAGAFGEVYQMEATLDPDDVTGTRIIFSNSAGFNTYFPEGTVVTFITCTKEVQIGDGEPVLAEWNPFAYQSTIYSDENLSITVSGEYLNFGPYEFVLTKL